MTTLFVRRLTGNPVIRPDMLAPGERANINGPSLIETPDWLPGRLGRYYLYFAHHAGTFIRLAYSDDLSGPWTIHARGTLHLADAPGCEEHIASPDVHVDEGTRSVIMYFHGPQKGGGAQRTFFSRSSDGLNFSAHPGPLAPFYLRVVRHGQRLIGMSKGGRLFVADSWEGPFRPIRRPAFPMSGPQANSAGDVRHVALDLQGDSLAVYFTRIGDAPEHILRAEIDLRSPPRLWRAGPAEVVLAPDTAWEGSDLPLRPSKAGAAGRREHALRDPAIFHGDGRVYLLYSVAGEAGIAIAELLASPPPTVTKQ